MNLWEPKQRIERSFRRSLQTIAKEIILRVGDNPSVEKIQYALRNIAKSKAYNDFAEASALKMATQLFDDMGKTWREAAFYNSKGNQIYEMIQKELLNKGSSFFYEQVKKNADIIKTLPGEIANDVTSYVAKETNKGRRASDIAKEIFEKFPAQTRARADLIARTEVSKTQSAITELRCRQFGVNWYVWRAVGGSGGDGRTRKSHRSMANVLVCWDEAPAPEDLFPTIGKTGRRYHNSLGHYHAGCCPNCRCYARPVINLDAFTWPMRIYRNGTIQRISRREFSKLINAS